MSKHYPRTPDGRYFVARGRLWRCTNPRLDDAERERLVKQLMQARRAVKHAETPQQEKAARAGVHDAKVALGERGPVWWPGDAPDETRRKPENSRYADWWQTLAAERRHDDES